MVQIIRKHYPQTFSKTVDHDKVDLDEVKTVLDFFKRKLRDSLSALETVRIYAYYKRYLASLDLPQSFIDEAISTPVCSTANLRDRKQEYGVVGQPEKTPIIDFMFKHKNDIVPLGEIIVGTLTHINHSQSIIVIGCSTDFLIF